MHGTLEPGTCRDPELFLAFDRQRRERGPEPPFSRPTDPTSAYHGTPTTARPDTPTEGRSRDETTSLLSLRGTFSCVSFGGEALSALPPQPPVPTDARERPRLPERSSTHTRSPQPGHVQLRKHSRSGLAQRGGRPEHSPPVTMGGGRGGGRQGYLPPEATDDDQPTVAVDKREAFGIRGALEGTPEHGGQHAVLLVRDGLP